MKITAISSLLFISLLMTHISYSQRVYKFKQEALRKDEIGYFIIRKPKGRDLKTSGVNGVICYSSFTSDKNKIKKQIESFATFADENGLAVISWTRAQFGHDKNANFKDQQSRERKFFDDAFEPSLKSWKYAIPRICQIYNLPKTNFLMFGISGGAQWAHRFVLREPKYFAAVHIAIGSSFSKPTVKAKNVLWLLTTGELEVGYDFATAFYKECKRLNYMIIFKASENVGHTHTPEVKALGNAFFRYALNKIEEGGNDSKKVRTIYRKEFEYPEYYADYTNQFVVHKTNKNLIQPAFSVNLQSKDIAQSWGRIIKE